MSNEEATTPHIGEAMDMNDIVDHLSTPDVLEDYSWVLMDWREASIWIREMGGPEENEYGNVASMKERILWVVANADKIID